LAETGAVQASTIYLLLAACIAGYLIYAIFPAFSDNFLLKQAIQQVANDAWRLVGREELKARVLAKLPTIGSHSVANATGHLVQVPGLKVSDGDVQIVCTDHGEDCSAGEGEVAISVEYVRTVPLPFLKEKTISIHFHPSARAALTPVVW
jgi:hypothetical protein